MLILEIWHKNSTASYLSHFFSTSFKHGMEITACVVLRKQIRLVECSLTKNVLTDYFPKKPSQLFNGKGCSARKKLRVKKISK